MSWPVILAALLAGLRGTLSLAVSHWQILVAAVLGLVCAFGTDWHVRLGAYAATMILGLVYMVSDGKTPTK